MRIMQRAKKYADFAMIVLLPLLMAYSMVGEAAHEWLGTAMLVLFVIHHVLNFQWFKSVAKGKYPPARICSMIINLLLLIDMLALAVSSIILSRYIFSFLPIDGGTSFARTLHLLASYWGMVIMSLHLGLHCGLILQKIQKMTVLSMTHRIRRCIQICCSLISIYGIYVFYSRHIGDYMLLKTQFVFFDFDEKLILFLLDYLTMMILFATAGYYLQKIFVKIRKRKKHNKIS